MTEAYLRRVVEETRRIYATEQLQLTHILDERKLAHPTFKFIQDVVRELMSKTRILRDVFSPADFDPKRRGSVAVASSDRHARVEFVQKLIDFVANNKHPAQGCVASKIVAGSDPVKTNELLQNLARVAIAKLQERQQRTSGTSVANNTRQQQQQQTTTSTRQVQPPVQFKTPSTSGRRQSLKESKSTTPRKSSGVQEPESRIPAESTTQPVGATKATVKVEKGEPEEVQFATTQLPATTNSRDERREDNLELLTIELKKLNPKLEQMAKLDQHLVQKLQNCLAVS